MIKGAIEEVRDGRVSGWISDPDASLRGAILLAFNGRACVGSGTVEVFRQDIADAGLGDGHAGFTFGVTPPAPGEEHRIVVRLQGSDLALVQARLTEGAAVGAGRLDTDTVAVKLESLRWMRARGWLEPSEFDALRALWKFGVYERGLQRRDAVTGELETGSPADQVADLLSIYHQRPVRSDSAVITGWEALEAFLAERRGTAEPVFGLWSAVPVRLTVAEGSHAATQGEGGAGVGYEARPEQVLMLDARCAILSGDLPERTQLVAYHAAAL